MACNDDFITCLSARDKLLYREGIHVDDIQSLSSEKTKVGKLVSVLTLIGRPTDKHPHPYYRCWIRRSDSFCSTKFNNYNHNRAFRFIKTIKTAITANNTYPEIFIVAFTDEGMTIPRHISPGDYILKFFTDRFSPQLRGWIDEFIDEFAPKEEKPNENSDDDSDDSGSDDEGDHDFLHH